MTEGVDRLRERCEGLPEALRAQLAVPDPPTPFDPRRARRIVTTGVGSSAAHARFLAHALSEELGLPARFVSTGAVAAAGTPGRLRDALIVFSQGLSPNARFAFERAEDWGAVVVVTAQGSSSEPGERSRWLTALRARGAVVVDFAAPDEFGTLVRILGPLLGFAAALSLARSLARGAGLDPSALEPEPERLVERVRAAPSVLDGALPTGTLEGLSERELVLLAAGGYGELLQNLRTKLLEGMLRPLPALWDGLELAHGGLQQFWPHRTAVLHLARAGRAEDEELATALAATVDRGRHEVVRLVAQDGGLASVFEHEVMLDALLLRWFEATSGDPTRWPARGEDGPLYDRSPRRAPDAPALARALPALDAWDELAWPECERQLASGRCTAVFALGSIEQHGPHLPLATDTWLAECLVRRVATRIEGAVPLPVLPLGCAEEHAAFPGTLSLEPETFERVVGDVLSSLASQGFGRAFVFSAHGGNLEALRSAGPRLVSRSAPMDLVICDDHAPLWRRLAARGSRLGVDPVEQGLHAGELETSILRALAPGSVQWARAEAGVTQVVGDGRSLFYPSLRSNAPNGVVGDPRRADPGRAEPYLEEWVDTLVGFYGERVDQ